MASHFINTVYVARDIERALGKTPKDGYYIITNRNPHSESIHKLYPNHVFLIDSNEIDKILGTNKILDTYELLILPEVADIIMKLNAEILVFKNTIHIEAVCKEKGWKLLNPSAVLSEKVENKITQVQWLDELASLLPPHKIQFVKDIVWDKKPFILQWSHGHTGDGTILISNEKDLANLREKFPHRDARITDFIKGPMFTANIVVTDKEILIGNISYQITGMLPFTENAFSTIGNDWSIPHTILSEAHTETFDEIAKKVGKKMQKEGWRGLFGIDVIHDEEKDMMHLIEINARQPASTTFESELQSHVNLHGVPGITTFDAHISTLTHLPITGKLILINDGAQILQRVTSLVKKVDDTKLVSAGYKVIHYKQDKINADLARIQTTLGIMETHNKLNKRGKEILELL